MPATTPDPAPLDAALAMEVVEVMEVVDRSAGTAGGARVRGRVHEGFDVFDIPHGGYLAAVVAKAVLLVAGEPDLFTLTVHYLRKAAVGPMDLVVTPVGGSRRFGSWQVTADQGDGPVLTALVSVGDRTAVTGPSWTDARVWDPSHHRLSPPAGDPGVPFRAPRIAERFKLRMEVDSATFATGKVGEPAQLRATLATADPDQLTAVVACDLTPPAVWNALGAKGWVPTVELTAHVRARPGPGPLAVEVATHHVQDGFLEEDAVVRDAAGRLVVQSRQLARWTEG